jgi:hippurate hydrolase
LELTVRSYTDEVRKQLLDGIKRKANAAAAGAGAPEPMIAVSEGTPAMYNNDELVARLLPTLQKTLGKEHVIPAEPAMGGEDFSEYGRAGVPSFMFWLGSVQQKRLDGFKRFNQEPPSLHSPVYYPDAEETLTTGITAMTAAVLDLLPAKK